FSSAGFAAEPIYAPTDPKKPAPPVLRAFKIHIAPDTRLGTYDVRLVTRLGVSNPAPFVVTDLQIIDEKESNDDIATAQRVPLNSLPTAAIGSRVAVDYLASNANKGRGFWEEAPTPSMDSRLMAHMPLSDAAGKHLVSCRPLGDPVSLLDVPLPASGD